MNEIVYAGVTKGLKKVSGKTNSLTTSINDSLWEAKLCGLGIKSSRLMFNRFKRMQDGCLNRLFTVWTCCMHEGFGREHASFMHHIEEPVRKVKRVAHHLFKMCLKAAVDGKIDEHEAETLRALTVTDAFGTSKAALGLPPVSADLLHESGLCLNLCAYAHMAEDFATELLNHEDGTKLLEPVDEEEKWHPFTINADPDHITYVVKFIAAIISGIAIGFEGYGFVICSYNAGIAITTNTPAPSAPIACSICTAWSWASTLASCSTCSWVLAIGQPTS